MTLQLERPGRASGARVGLGYCVSGFRSIKHKRTGVGHCWSSCLARDYGIIHVT